MDPNTALQAMRRAIRIMHRGTDEEREHAGVELADLVTGLDEWLTRGGFLPTEWQASR
jgi:hypothetical protein